MRNSDISKAYKNLKTIAIRSNKTKNKKKEVSDRLPVLINPELFFLNGQNGIIPSFVKLSANK